MTHRGSPRREQSARREREEDNRRGKQRREDKIERITWFLLVLIFGILYILPEDTAFPNFLVPAAGAVILLGSGMFQYVQRMRVSPITWIGGTVMALIAGYNGYITPNANYFGLTLIVFASVIGVGVLTGET